MRPFATAAALCAALLTFTSSARADEDVPQPVSRTVIEPPHTAAPPEAAEPAGTPPPAAQPAPAAPPPQAALAPAPAPRAPRSEIGFSLRMGGAETDRFLFGGSFGGASGPLMVGLSGDVVVDTRGTNHHSERWSDDDGHHSRWCSVRSDGRCTSQADLSMAGYLGVRHKTGPVLGGARLRLELAGELGWQWSYVDERVSNATTVSWSDGARAYPIAGLRAQLGLTVFRNATFGVGGYARRGLAGRVCVTTDGGCTKVGGTTAGLYFFGGGDWGFGG